MYTVYLKLNRAGKGERKAARVKESFQQLPSELSGHMYRYAEGDNHHPSSRLPCRRGVCRECGSPTLSRARSSVRKHLNHR